MRERSAERGLTAVGNVFRAQGPVSAGRQRQSMLFYSTRTTSILF